MNPSSSILNGFNKLILDKIKDFLEELFLNCKFVIFEKKLILSIKNTYVYEKTDSNDLFFEDDINTEDEYIVYSINVILDKVNLNKLLNNNKLYGLNIIFFKNINSLDFSYEPEKVFIEDKLKVELYKEYIDVYRLFNQLRIFNHNNTTRLKFTLPGRIYNRPDREYLIVMNNNYNFNIQVFKINSKNEKEKMLFGMWMNVSSCGKKISSEPFFL